MAELEKSGKVFDWQVFKQILPFVSPYKDRFVLLTFLTISLALLAPLQPYLIQLTIDQYIIPGDTSGLNRMIIVLFAIIFLQVIVQYSHTYLSGWLGQSIVRDIRVRIYKHILSLKLKFYDKTPIGRLVTRTISDTETLSQVFTSGIASMIGDILQLIAILGIMFYTHWQLTLVSLCTFPILIIATYLFKEGMKHAFNDVRTAVSNLNSFVQEHITGMSIVQIFNSEAREYEKFKAINQDHLKANLKAVLYNAVYFPVAEVVAASGTGLIIWYGAREVLDAEGVTLGLLTAFILYVQRFYRPIRMLADKFNVLQMGIVSSDRILKVLHSQEHIQDSGTLRPKNIEGNVTFEKVWFAYKDDHFVLKNINFEVKKGQTVAFVGATGAGKSSIINLICRFYEINKGHIRIDDHDIRDYDLATLRSHIGIVLQDVFLFSDTVANNISLGNPDISREQMRAAAEAVGALPFIERLPNGFDQNVMERGATLSVGQRQLISFVRAMVYDPKIIILDEATSSVDSETEELIQQAIDRLMNGRTAIVIAHRLATIKKADQIVVLDKGEVKEVGKHEELLALGGWYASLHQMQYKEVV